MKTACFLMLMAVAAAGNPGGRDEPVSALESRISVDYRDIPLSEALDRLHAATGLNFYLAEAENPKVRIIGRDLKVRSILALMLRPLGLGVTWEDGVLAVCGCRRLAGSVTTRIYDVRGWDLKLRDFPGFHVQQPKLLIAAWGPELCGRCFEYSLTDLVRENTGDNSWDSNPKVSLCLVNGLLIVTQSARVHREIEELLARLPM